MSARIRTLLHELADAVADELEGRAPTAPASRARQRRAPVTVDAPLPPVSETDRARAKDLLRRKGIHYE